jgi:hypothetical protein
MLSLNPIATTSYCLFALLNYALVSLTATFWFCDALALFSPSSLSIEYALFSFWKSIISLRLIFFAAHALSVSLPPPFSSSS